MVFGLLDRDNDVTPGIVAPQVSLSFGGGGGGALGGLAPDIGPFASGTDLAEGLLSLTLSRGFAPFVDWADCLLQLPPGADPLPPLGEVGNLTITVGDRSTAFAFTLDSISHDLDGALHLGLGNGARALAQARLSSTYGETSAGDIIAALCSEAGVDAQASGGPVLARYFVDGGRSLLDHIAALAASAGRLARFNDENTLELVDDASAGEEIPIASGDAVLAARLSERVATGAIRVTGAGATDPAWLRKDAGPNQAQSGATSPLRDTSAPWLRSADGLEEYAAARGRALERDAAPGTLSLAAYPDAQPGSILAISGTGLDGQWRVTTSTLSVDPQAGFVNQLAIARADPDAGALGLQIGFP